MDALPNEILASVLAQLTCPDLALVSLVSRAWQVLAFPHLYHTVYFSLGAHLDHFCERVASGDGNGSVSICANVKGLVLYHKYGLDHALEIIDELHLGHLDLVVHQLTQLRHLSWELYFVPERTDTKIIRSFQTRCPRLESVHLWFGEGFDYYYSPQYPLLFQFKGLTHLSITSEDTPGIFHEDCCHALTSLLTSCPNLVSVMFDLPTSSNPYCPNRLIESLGKQFTFPRLRTLRFRGSVHPNWAAFFNYSESDIHPLRSFLTRHPEIEDLGLGSCIGDRLPDNVDLNGMPLLFPAVKSFEGPEFLCNAIVRSALVGQLESLYILDKALRSEGSSEVDMTLGVGSLPRLRRLGIWAGCPVAGSEVQMCFEVQMLKKYVVAASALEELEIGQGVDSNVEFLDLLKQASNLRKLTITEGTLQALGNKAEVEVGLDVSYWS